MKLTNHVKNTNTIKFEELKKYKFNDLKDSDRNIAKLKNAIKSEGFISPFLVYDDESYILDGKGRYLALMELEREGVIIDELPIVSIHAKDLKTAKKIVLQLNSQHGDITQISLDMFTIDFELAELRELQQANLAIDELDFKLDLIDIANSDLPQGRVTGVPFHEQEQVLNTAFNPLVMMIQLTYNKADYEDMIKLFDLAKTQYKSINYADAIKELLCEKYK